MTDATLQNVKKITLVHNDEVGITDRLEEIRSNFIRSRRKVEQRVGELISELQEIHSGNEKENTEHYCELIELIKLSYDQGHKDGLTDGKKFAIDAIQEFSERQGAQHVER